MDVSLTSPQLLNRPLGAAARRLASVIVLPLLGFICYCGPYVTGLAYRSAYLKGLSIPSGLFKSDTSDYFVYAYLAVLETFKNWTSFISSPTVWFAMIGTISLLTFEMLLISKLRSSAWANSISAKLSMNKYVALTTGTMSLATAITALLLLIPLILLPLLILPGVVGNYGAKVSLTRDLDIYDKGCGRVLISIDHCHALMDGSRIVAAGFLVTASTDRVALYNDGKPSILPIKDYVITTLSPIEYKLLASKNLLPAPIATP